MTDTASPTPSAPTAALNNLLQAVDGKKTYITIAVAAVVIVLNHFGLWPQGYLPVTLDPNAWLSDLWTLALVSTGRSAITKVQS